MKKFFFLGLAVLGIAILATVNVNLSSKSSNVSEVVLKNLEALSSENESGKVQYKVISAGPNIMIYYDKNGNRNPDPFLTCRAVECTTEMTTCIGTGNTQCTEKITIKECTESYNHCLQYA
jgi:hypothetical protein